MREALLRGFRVFPFGLKVAVFFATVGISGSLSATRGGFLGIGFREVFIRDVGVLRGKGEHIFGLTVRWGVIVGILGFIVFLGSGGHIFSGGGSIKVVVRTQGVFMGSFLHEVFVFEVGFLQGEGDRNGEATSGGGKIAGLLDLCFWLEGGRLFRNGWEFRIVDRSQGGFLGADAREVFVCGVGVLQGVGVRDGGATGRRGSIVGF